MSRHFRVVNLSQYQHYKDRNPPWIKLHNTILDSYEFGCLQDASKLHLLMIWLLASRHDNRLPCDHRWIASRIQATTKVDLDVLVKHGFLELIEKCEQCASASLPSCKHLSLSDRGETEDIKKRRDREETTLSGAPKTPAAIDLAEFRAVDPDSPQGILKFLNEKSGKRFLDVECNIKLIKARLQEYSPKQLRQVIANRIRTWGNDPHMQEFIRPATLFGREKCAQYIGELKVVAVNGSAEEGDPVEDRREDLSVLLGGIGHAMPKL